MSKFLFVNELSDENLRSQQTRAHAAKVGCLRHKQNVQASNRFFRTEPTLKYCTANASAPREHIFSSIPSFRENTIGIPANQHPGSSAVVGLGPVTAKLGFAPDLRIHNDESDENEARSTTTVLPMWVRPTLSSYLKETYQASSARELSGLWDYLLSYYGPIFIWVPFDNEDERTSFRTFIISGWLYDPAQCEAVLALAELIRINDFSTSRSIEVSRALFQQQGRALNLLRNKLNNKQAALDKLVLWTIFCILMIQFELGDWQSYTINLFGLRHVIALHGGSDALAVEDPRSAAFARQLEGVYTNHLINLHLKQTDLYSEPVKVESSDLLRKKSSYASWSLQRSLSQLPEGLASFYMLGQLHRNVAETLCQCMHYLHRSEHTKDDPTLPKTGSTSDSNFFQRSKLLDRRPLTTCYAWAC